MHQQPIAVSPFLDRPGLDPAPEPPANLFLSGGRWVAACAICGCQLTEGPDQERVERKAARGPARSVWRSPDPDRAAGGPVASQSRSD